MSSRADAGQIAQARRAKTAGGEEREEVSCWTSRAATLQLAAGHVWPLRFGEREALNLVRLLHVPAHDSGDEGCLLISLIDCHANLDSADLWPKRAMATEPSPTTCGVSGTCK